MPPPTRCHFTPEALAAPLCADKMKSLPKPTAMERAEKRKLDRDMDICVGC